MILTLIYFLFLKSRSSREADLIMRTRVSIQLRAVCLYTCPAISYIYYC